MNGSLAGRRIGLLTASASRLGGGVAEAVIVQTGMIRALGGDAVILALADRHGDEDRARYHPAEVRFSEVRGPPQIGFAPKLVADLLDAGLDLLHLHGIWMYPSRAGARWARQTGKPYVISPHGMLDPWITGRGRLKKAAARLGYERDSWRRASAFHALTAREAGDILDQTGRGESLVIANAGPPALSTVPPMPAPHVVYLGRIHSKKNLKALVEGWTRLAPGAGARLTIAGWGDEASIAELEAALAIGPDTAKFIGPVFCEDKQRLLESARFTILPSFCEGLPMSVLEGWALGAPAIMSEECNLLHAYDCGAALDCGYSAETIAAALERALGLDEPQWRAMAQASLALAAGPYSSDTISRQWGEAYSALLTRGSP